MHIEIKEVNVTLDHDDWSNLVEMAGYGINYWADAPCVVDSENETYEVGHSDQPVTVGDQQVTRTTLTKEQLQEAMARLLAGQVNVADRIVGYIRDNDIDADAADVIIQVALFGEVVFG